MIRLPQPQEFTQGTIFTGAIAADYRDQDVYGLVITARCDAAHQKTRLFNYIPVVRFEDWLIEDCLQLVAKRVQAAAQATIRQAVAECGLPESVLRTIPHGRLLENLLEGSNAERRAADRISKALEQIDRTEEVTAISGNRDSRREFLNANSRTLNPLIKELLGNGISDFHFIDQIDPYDNGNGYVALLREIRFLPADLARDISSGLDFDTFSSKYAGAGASDSHLSLSCAADFCMPLSTIESPYIEFLMQRLTHLFSRIGVTDTGRARLDQLQSVAAALS